MIRHLTCSADTYISSRVIDGTWVNDGNVGCAGTLDLYKLYGQTFSVISGSRIPNTELTRLLVSFDDRWLVTAAARGELLVAHPSFKASLILRDAYGGQAAPVGATIVAWPLSASFSEGLGRDIVFMSDNDVANWLSSSAATAWHVTGCGSSAVAPAACDYFTGSAAGPFSFTGTLTDGTEDLVIDVTRAVRERILSGTLPSLSFRLSLSSEQESNALSYFVKRFSARHAHDPSRTPRLELEWNSAIWDDTLCASTDTETTLMTAFHRAGALTNVTSGSTQLTGSGCMLLTLHSGSWSASFSASQHYGAEGSAVGLYSSSFTLSSDDQTVSNWLTASGSFPASLRWSSLSGKILRDDERVIFKQQHAGERFSKERLVISYVGLASRYSASDVVSVKMTTFDPGSPSIRVSKTPRRSANIPLSGMHVGVLDALTDVEVIAPRLETRSTEASLMRDGHEWKMHASVLAPGGSYKLQAYVAGERIGQPSPPFAVDR